MDGVTLGQGVARHELLLGQLAHDVDVLRGQTLGVREMSMQYVYAFLYFYPPSEEYIETSLLDPYPALKTNLPPISETEKLYLERLPIE